MEEDILKYSPTVMFRGTPCITVNFKDMKTVYPILEPSQCMVIQRLQALKQKTIVNNLQCTCLVL